MENQLSPETKRLITRIGSAVLIVILLSVLTWLTLTNAKKKSRDIQRLSDIRILQADLKSYFFVHNVYPLKILNKKSLEFPEKECPKNLCLDYVPTDPLTGVTYKYTPCRDGLSVECDSNTEDPKGFKIEYTLESNSRAISAGPKRVTANNIND